MKTQQKGFTLIELLVVIAIIGLLSTLAVVSLNNAREKSRDAKRVSDIKSIQTALELYFVDNEAYPNETAARLGGAGTDCVADGAGTVACLMINGNGVVGSADSGTPIYMGTVPRDPSSPSVECTGSVGAVCDYSYNRSAATTYEIYAYLEGTVGSLSGEICADENGIHDGACP